jgi:hypothetical protein
LDPFAGSGTALVEAIVSGRDALGVDLNPIGCFVSRAKTSVLSPEQRSIFENWCDQTIPKLNAQRPPEKHDWWREMGYQKDLPWPVRKALEFALNEAASLEDDTLVMYARCAILRAGKQALDCTKETPSIGKFRSCLGQSVDLLLDGSESLRTALSSLDRSPTSICLQKDASDLSPSDWNSEIDERPSIVITSPPYPGVHVLYHRWQIRGRKETPAPYWIIDSPDGHGASHYTMGSRTEKGIDDFFEKLEETFSHLHSLLADGALIFQLVGFSDSEDQLPRFLDVMEKAGFAEVTPSNEVENEESPRVTRRVPSLRKWYASLQGKTSSTREHLIVHRKIRQRRINP